jgi:DNA-binding CsgD family transcriptional regulator
MPANVSSLADYRNGRRKRGPARPRTARATARVHLRGRDDELTVIGDRIAALTRGEGGILLLDGPAGIGKSAVVSAAADMARRSGVRTVCAEALESQQTVPFMPLFSALADAGLEPPSGAESHFWVVHELQGLLELAALQQPLLVVLDDLQWADGATLLVLSTLPQRLEGSPILWLLARRSNEGRPAVRQAVTRLRGHGAERLALSALAADAVADVISDVLRLPADDHLLALAAPARGNPFLVIELLEGLREEGRLDEEPDRAPPRRVTDLLRDRLDRLSPEAAHAVQIAAVLGPCFAPEQLAAMLSRTVAQLVPLLEEAMRADLLVDAGDTLAFRHDLLREGALACVPASVRRAVQREAVAILLDRGAAPVEVAQQLAESAEPGDRVAVGILREAAQTLATSDAAAAADLSRRALELLPYDDEERGSLVAETIILLNLAMRPDDARALGESLLPTVSSPALEAELRLNLSTMLARSFAVRAEENRLALGLLGVSPEMRARHRWWYVYNLGFAGKVELAAYELDSALADGADRTTDTQARFMAALARSTVDRLRGRYLRALEGIEDAQRIAAAAEPEPYMLLLGFHRSQTLCNLGRLEDAHRVLVDGIARGRRERNAWLLEISPGFGSLLYLHMGRLGDARTEALANPALYDEVQADNLHSAIALWTLGEVSLRTGDASRLRPALAAARRAHESATPVIRRYAAWLLALDAAARGDHGRAARWLHDDELAWAMPTLPCDPAGPAFVARVALAAGDAELLDGARTVAATFERENPGVALYAGVAAQVRGLTDGDATALVDAAAVLRETERPLAYAGAAEDAGRALLAAGRGADGIAQLEAALEVYSCSDATADAARVQQALRAHGVRRRTASPARAEAGWAGLTGSELRVVRLVAAGATNRDAAEQLYLSPHTVSSHLRSAFAKLEINSRVELARLAAREEPDLVG